MVLTRGEIEMMAPDKSALQAAAGLLKPAKWPVRARAGEIVWGECQGSGANPYRVAADTQDRGTKCTCPSRKFPFYQRSPDAAPGAAGGAGGECDRAAGPERTGRPAFNPGLAARVAALGVPVFACTPDQFPALMAAALRREDIHAWAAREDIKLVREESP